MCRGAGKATRDNLKGLIPHYEWLRSLPDPAPLLTSISEAKIGQWANEAQRLKARELREYVAPRRNALVLAALRDARGRVLDDMAAMLLKLSKKVVWISQRRLAESHVEESTDTGTLIAVLAGCSVHSPWMCHRQPRLSRWKRRLSRTAGSVRCRKREENALSVSQITGSHLPMKRSGRTAGSCWRLLAHCH